MTVAGTKSGNVMRSIGAKTLLALAAAALPALAVAAILGITLVTAVYHAETEFDGATSAARRLTEIRVLIEKEHGLIVRLPAELDLRRIEAYARQIAGVGQELETNITALAAIDGIVAPDALAEIRAIHLEMKRIAEAIVNAAKSFAQTTALELVDGPYDETTKLLRTFLDAVGSNVDGIVEHARSELEASAQWAWRLTPVALVGALFASVFGLWMTRRTFVLPLTRLTEHVVQIGKSGRLDVGQDSRILQREDEIGTLWRSFNLMIADLFEARTRLAQSEAEIRMQFERLDAALNNMLQGLCMFDSDQRLLVWNRRFLSIFGLAPELLRPGMPVRELIELTAGGELFRESADEILAEIERCWSERTPSAFLRELNDGRAISIMHEPIASGGWLTTYEDITERRRAEAKISHMARHDALTNLPNRVLFREHMEESLGRLRRDERLAVLCLDLDHFKHVNDTLGHPIGDNLLQAVAVRLLGCIRESDVVARLGGDEFAVVQIGCNQPAEATQLAARIIDVLSAPYDLQNHHVVVGASIGVAVTPTDGSDPDQLLKSADLALYRAKADGRGAYRFFEPAMDARAQTRRLLESDLRTALRDGEFELYYQPIVQLGTDEIAAFEALLRWNHPRRGMVAPLDFISVAEESGLIANLGAWVLRKACAEAATWSKPVRVAVNLSPMQFKSRELVQTVFSALAASGLAPDRLELEITESALLQDTETTLATLHQLRSFGVRIAMDDFGTGYSSLSYLRSFPFDKIKIDRSFIHELSTRGDCQAIVRAVTGLGSSLGIATTAEGVETREQLKLLKLEGCTEVQGYLFSPPRPAAEVEGLLAARSKHRAVA